jgi:hypothetical protein
MAGEKIILCEQCRRHYFCVECIPGTEAALNELNPSEVEQLVFNGPCCTQAKKGPYQVSISTCDVCEGADKKSRCFYQRHTIKS